MALIDKVKKFPLTPGVYLFLDKRGEVLYAGRAISLRRRVLNYFQKNLSDSRIKEMVGLAKNIKFKKTDTLLEAIILEANLIKKYWPKYNVKDRDNRSFLYIIFPKSDYLKPIIVRQRELQKFPNLKARIFGPYSSLAVVKGALKIIRRIFPYSTCKPFSGKPCFDYQIGLCPGLCVGEISKEDYQKNIDNLISFLRGEKKKLFKKLQKENPEKIQALKHIQDVSLIAKFELGSSAKRIEGYDISHLAGKESYGSMVVFENGLPNKNQYRLFKIKQAPAGDDLRALKEVILRRFNHSEWRLPDIILIDGGKPQIDYVFKVLNSRHINIPLVGISKLGGDKLVFPPKTKKSIKDLAKSINEVLLKVRDESHRFALKSSRRKRQIIFKVA